MKKSLSIAFVALFILTACSSVPSKAPAATVGQAKQPVVQQPPVEGATVETEGERDVPVSRYGSNLKCDMLKISERKQECEMQINDMIGRMLESEIMSSFDSARCSELAAELVKDCQDKLAERGVQGPVTTEEIAFFNEITRGTMSEDPEKQGMVYDKTRCAELKTGGYKEYCEKQMTERAERDKLLEIRMANDKTRCNELTTQSMKTECKRFFGEEVVEEVAAPVEPTTDGTPANQ